LTLAVLCSVASAQNAGYPLKASVKTERPNQVIETTALPELAIASSQPMSEQVQTVAPTKDLSSTIAELSHEFERAYGMLDVPVQRSNGIATEQLPTDQLPTVQFNAPTTHQSQVVVQPQVLDNQPITTNDFHLGNHVPFAPSDSKIEIVSLPPQAEIQLASANYNDWANPNENVIAGSFEVPNSAETRNFSGDFIGTTPEQVDSITWWKQHVLEPVHSPNSTQSVDSNGLVYRTLQNSPRIFALSQSPMIRDLQVIEADASFDPTTFVQSQFQDRVDPVGDNLSITSDGSDFLEDHIWSGEFGLRKKTRTGMTYEVGQSLGFKNSNSSFFDPQDQGTATLALNVTQPLLKGRGRYYNESQILIAQSTGGAAWNTFAAELQDEIQKTVKAYWRLYYDRSVHLQKRRNVERGEKILRTLEGRAGLDSLPSQIARARSAVQSRKTDLANALRDIRDSETELRRLTADKNWKANQFIEMIPTESPVTTGIEVELESGVFSALEHRPEIKEAMTKAKIAGIQREISANELLPELSFLMGTYVSALKGESQLGQAIQDQFGEVTPGYSVGLEFEIPIGNRAARSRLAQRKLQLAKIRAEVDVTIQNIIAESQVSLRRVTSAKETLDAATQAIIAANADLEQNFRRWESFALIEGDIAEGQTPTTVLDQLLDSQERLTAAELVYTQAELELKTSEVALKRTMGTLLIHEKVSLGKALNGDLPELIIEKSN